MEIIVSLIVGFIAAFIVFSFYGVGQDNKLLEELTKCKREKAKLEEALHNAEARTTRFVRTIKSIEDIVFSKGQGTIVDRIDKIKELFTDCNQRK